MVIRDSIMSKYAKKYHFLLKITLIFFICFLVAATAMWVFLKSTARNIGYYLTTGRKNTAIVLITEYLGNPPSRLKAKVLSNLYDIAFKYSDNEIVKWSVGKRLELHFGGKPMMKNETVGRMHRMMRNMFKKDIYLGNGKTLSIYFSLYPHRKMFILPIIFIFLFILIIAALIFYLLRRTLMPIQKLIEASHKIGNGDLSYRLKYDRNDEFRNVVNAFNIMTEKVEVILKSQRELLHMISHELRTPLTRISLALELRDYGKSKAIIKGEVREINELIESIIELSRLENEQIGIEKSDIIQVVKHTVENFNNIQVKVLITNSSAIVKGKSLLLERAIGNIISNAVKYTNNREPVYVELRKERDYYICEVTNTGKGLDEEEIKKIFEPFYRGKNAIEGLKDGKGLGLVVTHRIIEGAGGKIECKSNPEGPTIFILKIPEFKP